jgi:hypothetical protein
MDTGSKMRRASLKEILLVLLVSLFLLSILSNILTGYPEQPNLPQTEKERTERDTGKEPSVLLFKVSPVMPQLYWRISTADHYTGLNWLRTTDEEVFEEFPQVQDANATEAFTVEIDLNQQETLLPLPPPSYTLTNLSSAPTDGLKLHIDNVGSVCKVVKHEQAEKIRLIYNVSWRDVEVDDKLISLDNTTEDFLDKYLQLPYIPIEVWKLAEDLENPSYSALDQILADVQYLRTNFVYDFEQLSTSSVYDFEHSQSIYERIRQGSDISSYIKRKKGICIDAATTLVVILRIQKIPARISIGYNPERIHEGKLLYYTSGAHAVTEVYLPPYGWIQFDATPPLEENPLVKVSPFKKVCSPGSRLFYQLSITNRRDTTDDFKLYVENKQKWNIEAAPKELRIEALQTADALLEVTIPDDVDMGEKDVLTVTVTSWSSPKVAFSVMVILQVENTLHTPTTTTLRSTNEAVVREDKFWVNGTVLATSDERADDMAVYVFLTKSTKAEGIIVGKGFSKQGNFQIAGKIPPFMEVEDYRLITISLGTTRYAPSNTTDIVRVSATTRMELGAEEEFLLGYGAIQGHLLWDNETGLAEAAISLRITSLAAPSETWKLQDLTSNDGSFRIKTTFENPGVYEVRAMFSGNEYVLGSNATRVVELKYGQPTIRLFGENIATRGEVFNITMKIQHQDIAVLGEPVTVAFDNQPLATIETGRNGSCTWSFLVDSEEKLGLHNFTATLEESNTSAVHKVAVKSKTRLATNVSEVAGGMFLLFSASLSDDHDLPIQWAEITVDNYSLSWKTDRDGNLTFLLDTVKLWPEDLVLIAGFEGSELYLPVATEKEVVLKPLISLPFLIPLFAPTLVAVVFMYTRHYIGRRQTLQQASTVEVAKERVMAEEEMHRAQEMGPLKIVLPDIETKFPNVWGINDKLRIGVVLDKNVWDKIQKREAEVLVDEEPVASVKLSQQGRTELSHVFSKKGEHKLQATLPRASGHRPWNAEIKLHVVEYGEEIIRLYNKFLGKLASYDINTYSKMTAREIESLILRTGDFGVDALRKLTTCFEKAEYSNHRVARKSYEIMHLSFKELNRC